MKSNSFYSLPCIASVVILMTYFAPLYAAGEAELKDASGATIIKYVVEAPSGLAPVASLHGESSNVIT